ncbi:MAG TPA: hypothetical protein DCS97_04705 [Planctomycetes bacterium]|nr:hypothetical protein [Planctomycetota bacterium]
MAIGSMTPLHQCYYLGQEDVDPVHILTQYLIRNPQYARQREAACPVHIYVVAAPVVDRLSEPAHYLRKVTTTIGAIRAAAQAVTGEDFSKPPPTPEQVAVRKARKAAKKARKTDP